MRLVKGHVYKFCGRYRYELRGVRQRSNFIVLEDVRLFPDQSVPVRVMTNSGEFKIVEFYEGDLERFGSAFDGRNS